MGFVVRQVQVVKGQYTADAAGCKAFLQAIMDAVVDGGIWSADPSLCPDGEVIQLETTASRYTHGAYFVNQAGAKLGITYAIRGTNYPSDGGGIAWYSGHSPGGLVISVIPPGKGSFSPANFGTLETYAPVDATPPMGDAATGGPNTNDPHSAIYSIETDAADHWATYTLLMKGNTIAVFVRSSYSRPDSAGMIAAGELFGDTVWPEDNLPETKYASMRTGCYIHEIVDQRDTIRVANIRSNYAADAFYFYDGSVDFGAFAIRVRQAEYTTQNRNNENGLWKSAQYGRVSSGERAPQDLCRYDKYHSTAGSSRALATPILIYFDESVRIVAGSGVKGYLDTDWFLATSGARFQRGQKFDDGKYIYVGGGLLVGWDPDTSISIF